MNIMYISHDLNLSGASRSLLEIIGHLEYSNNIYVLVLQKKGDFYQELMKHRCHIICLPYYLWCVPKTSSLKWFFKKIRWYILGKFVNHITAYILKNIIIRRNIQIIHTNTGVCNIGALIRKDTNISHIWHIREFADLDFSMYPLSINKKYQEQMLNNTDLFIFNSRAVANHYSFLEKCNKKVIYNGISEEYIINDEEREEHSTINFLISGRVSKSKGHLQAIEACSMLLNEKIKNFKLYIAGSGNLKYRHSEELDKHIEFLGMQQDMVNVRKKMDVELVCSSAEAFGRVTVEAMYAGMPVIGSNVGGTPEIIHDGENGFLYELNNVQDLKNKMKQLILDTDLRINMGKTAQKYAIDRFSLRNCITQIESSYQEVLIRNVY